MRLDLTHQLVHGRSIEKTLGRLGMWIVRKGLAFQSQQTSYLVFLPLFVMDAHSLARRPCHNPAAIQADSHHFRRRRRRLDASMMYVVFGLLVAPLLHF